MNNFSELVVESQTKLGKFVVIEGIDGSGKTTIIKKLSEKLNELKIKHIITNEPTSSPIGKLCRTYLKSPDSIPQVDALLFAADRIEHYSYKIKTKLTEGFTVISDRYKYSSIVYQSLGEVKMSWLEEINSHVPEADIVYYIDISPEEAMERLTKQNRVVKEKFEDLTKLRILHQKYERLQEKYSFIRIKGDQSISIIVDLIANDLRTRN